MEFNSKCESFSFTGGDIILLEYRPKEHTISYLKEGSNLTYMQHIDPTESPINAVVNLTSIGDSVELIE